MYRRRKRRSRGTWFPTLGANLSIGGLTFAPNGIRFAFGPGIAPGLNLSISQLTFDQPVEPIGVAATNTIHLQDVIGNEWFLKRIVGKYTCWLVADPANDPALLQAPPVGVALGFFVARADSNNENEPNGFSALSADDAYAQYSPWSQQTMREPWIFRRTWLLGGNTNGTQYQNVGGTNFVFPSTVNVGLPMANWMYGSTLDGPHLDIRTKRRISNDDRLWAAVGLETSLFGIPGGGADQAVIFESYLDYRIFGSPRKARQRGNF